MSAAGGGGHWGLMGLQQWGGGEGQQGESISKNHPSHHKYKSPKQFL